MHTDTLSIGISNTAPALLWNWIDTKVCNITQHWCSTHHHCGLMFCCVLMRRNSAVGLACMTQLPLAEHYHKFLFRGALFPILEKLSESWHHLLRCFFSFVLF